MLVSFSSWIVASVRQGRKLHFSFCTIAKLKLVSFLVITRQGEMASALNSTVFCVKVYSDLAISSNARSIHV